MLTDCINGWGLFEFLVLIDALLDKDFFKRVEVQLLQQFVLANLQFLAKQVLGALNAVFKDVRDR